MQTQISLPLLYSAARKSFFSFWLSYHGNVVDGFLRERVANTRQITKRRES
jgi:hypothetical protein